MTIVPWQDSVSIEDAFIRLTIIRSEEQQKKEAEFKEKSKEEKDDVYTYRLSSYEDLYSAKTPIEPDKIFTADTNSLPPRRLLILGRAGIGKSTLCQYVAYQWTVNKLNVIYPTWPKLQAIFWIKFRNLNQASYPAGKSYSWIDVLNQECFQNNLSPDECRVLKNNIEGYSEQFLFLLDGYDEVLPEASSGHLKPALNTLCNQKTYYLITSRPPDVNLQVERRLEVMGFTPQDIETYTEHFFNRSGETTTTRAKNILNFLKRQPMVWGIAHIPLQLAMICQLAVKNQLPTEGNKPLTLSGLYDSFRKDIFKRFLIRSGKYAVDEVMPEELLQADYDHLQKAIGQLAYDNMLSNKIIFSVSDLTQAIKSGNLSNDTNKQIFKDCITCGLLRRINKSEEYYFIHLTFQEYFAAYTVAQMLKMEKSDSKPYQSMQKAILYHRYNPRLQVMWWFVAGHLSENITALKLFFDILITEPRDLLGNYELRLLLQCLIESREPTGLSITRDKLLHPLLISLQDKKLQLESKRKVIYALGKLGLLAAMPAILEGLLAALQDKDENIKSAAATTLGKFEPLITTSNKLFIDMQDKDENIKNAAAATLGKFGVAATTPAILDELLAALKDKNVDVKEAAITALGNIGVAAATPAILDGLLAALKDENRDIVKSAAYALGDIGPIAATPAILNRLLITLQYDKDDRTEDDYEEPDMAAMQYENEQVRIIAADTLGKLGTASTIPVILDKLLAALQNENYNVRIAVVKALGKLGTVTMISLIFNGLLTALQDKNEHVKSAATEALTNIVKATDSDIIFNLLYQTKINTKERDNIIEAVVFKFFTQNKALFYNPDTKNLCCWEKGNLKQYTFPSEKRTLLILKIRQVWKSSTHMPSPDLTTMLIPDLYNLIQLCKNYSDRNPTKVNVIQKLKDLLEQVIVGDISSDHVAKIFSHLGLSNNSILENHSYESEIKVILEKCLVLLQAF